MKLLSVNDLSLQNEGYFAFKHVAFSLSQNEIIGITGKSGSGKTQLLEAIADHKTPDSGEIEYTPGVRIGYLPQYDPQIIDQTVGKYLEDMRRIFKELAVRKEQLNGMITFMGLSPYLDRSVRQLSMGLRRQVEFLAAVAGHPNVLLLDEPFAFQSDQTATKMLELMQDLRDNGSGVILVATQFDKTIGNSIDTGYNLKDGQLQKMSISKTVSTELTFLVRPNSIAITKDIEQYITGNKNNLLEMKLPLEMKDAMITKMRRLNYELEAAENVKN